MTAPSAELIRAEVEARILVVDDEPEIATLLAEALREAEPTWHVVTETDACAALQRLTDDSFDCLITDLVMPKMGGLSLAQEARSLDEGLAMIAITGCATLESTIEAMRLGFADFIQKPFNLDLMRQAVQRTLRRRRRDSNKAQRLAELAEAKAELETSNAQISQKLDIASHDLVLSTGDVAEGKGHAFLRHGERTRVHSSPC